MYVGLVGGGKFSSPINDLNVGPHVTKLGTRAKLQKTIHKFCVSTMMSSRFPDDVIKNQ